MFNFFIVIHALICLSLIIVVLMQSSKGEGLAGALGGGGGISGAVFGGRGAASFLSKATTILATLFMVSCLSLSFMSIGRGGGSTSAEGGFNVSDRAAEDLGTVPQQAAPGELPAGGESVEDLLNPGTASDSQ